MVKSATAQKLLALRNGNEDHEWYPTTEEIMQAMKKDIWEYAKNHDDWGQRNKDKIEIREREEYDEKKKKYNKIKELLINTYLDIGAGDGRVLDLFSVDKKYGIEIARAQADDLIRCGVFIIGRNFWDVTLIDQYYSLIYSNPPFSQYEQWVCKILYESSFYILYLVMPERWINSKLIIKELEDRYEYTIVGQFDFSEADREARGKVNLVRINVPWKEQKETSHYNGKKQTYTAQYQCSVENAFARWVRESIADFKDKPEREWEEEEKTSIALKQTPIELLITNYEAEKETLGEAFRAIGKLDSEIIQLLGQDKKSMLEIIRKSISNLKKKYWRASFEKLDPVKGRMIRKTREKIFEDIEEFRTLDFNSDNVYSVVIWLINNCNIGILDQIGTVFDALTDKKFITEYKSNRHWTKGTWRNARDDWKFRELPGRWKLGLDYRIVLQTYGYDRYGDVRYTIVNDFIIICSNLGFPINPDDIPDYKDHQTEQKFHTVDGELAFTMRYFTGNKNVHLKINKRLLMKFNIEVAKIRKWMSDPDEVVEEYGVPKDEATRLWNSGLALIGNSDVKMLTYKKAI